MHEPTTDVLIVGAGPTGLTLALQLGRFGVPCRIIDTAPAPTDKSKALAIQARTLERFAAMGIAEAAIARGIRAKGLDFSAAGKPLGRARFTTDLDTPYPYILLLPQSATEELLIERLTGLGITVERGVTLTDFTQDTDGVRATLRHADGPEQTAHCRWLVGCDGAHSAVRHGLNLPFEGSAYEHTYWLADVRVHWPLTHDTIHAFLGTHGFLFAFPIPAPDRYRIVALWEEASHDTPGDPTLADIQRLMETLGPTGAVVSDPVWLTAFHLHHRKAARFSVGRVFVAGDAAHIHSPAGGQGMNTGIQDADNLAWKLALVAAGSAHPALLESYGAEREPVAAQVLRQTDLMFRLMTARSPALRVIRNRLLPLLLSRHAFVREMQRSIAEVGIRYRKSPIVAEDGRRGGPHAGSRVPNVSLIAPDGAATCLWALVPDTQLPQHTLLLLSGAKPAADDFARLATIRDTVAAAYGDVVAIRLIVAGSGLALDASWDGIRYDDPDLAVHKRYGAKEASLYLIRPDGYIGFRSRPASDDALRDYLSRIFVPAAQ